MDKFQALEEPMRLRKEKLSDALLLQQFFRDIEDEVRISVLPVFLLNFEE